MTVESKIKENQNQSFFVSKDGYLLQKVIHKDTIKEEIFVEDLDFSFLPTRRNFSKDNPTSPDVSDFQGYADTYPEDRERTRNKRNKFWDDNKIHGDKNKEYAWYITEIYHPYNRPKEGDRFFWYNDIGCLSGTAGIILVRDGYISAQKAIVRS